MLRPLTIMSAILCMALLIICPGLMDASEAVIDAKGLEACGRVALLRDKIDGLDLAGADELAAGLESLGFRITTITCDEMASPVSFNAARFDWLILTRSPDFPSAANENFLRYLRDGGDVVLMGGHPLTCPLAKYRDQKWRRAGLREYQGQLMPPGDVAAAMAMSAPVEKVLFDFDKGSFRAWQRNTSDPGTPTRLLSDAGWRGKGLQVEIKGLKGWDMHQASVRWRLPARHNVISFWARGDRRTPQLSLEIHEKDGSRWVKVVDLKTTWQRYALGEHDFRYLDRGEKAKRGRPGDCLNMARARKIAFGLATGITSQSLGDHTFWIDEVGSGRVDLPEDFFPPQANAPNVISDYEPVALEDVAHIMPSPGQALVSKSFAVAGGLEADEVIGFDLEDRAIFMPFLQAMDAAGKDRGCVGGLTVNIGPPYAGSRWIVSGIRSPEFYRGITFAQMLGNMMVRASGDEVFRTAQAANDRLKAQRRAMPPFNYVLGTQTFGPTYKFSDETKLVETAQAIWDMGSNALKLDLSPYSLKDHYQLPTSPEYKTLRDIVEKEPSYRKVLEMPFSYYLFWAYPIDTEMHWRKGLSPDQKQKEYKGIYDLSCYLLKTYSGTNKTFMLGNWEGDWCLLAGYDLKKDPTDHAIQVMIDWLNIRQQAVDDAKRDTPHKDVALYYYVELNAVRKAIEGGKTLANDVLPKTPVDLVSFSSYDSLIYDPLEGRKDQAEMSRRLKESLGYIESKLPPKKLDWEGRRVFIGEFGFPLTRMKDPWDQADWARAVNLAAIEWGCPFVLYWEMYDNEAEGAHGSGFWMINCQGKKQPVYIAYYRFMRRAREYVESFRREHGRAPSHEQYLKAAAEWLKTE